MVFDVGVVGKKVVAYSLERWVVLYLPLFGLSGLFLGFYTPLPLVEGGYTGITLSVRPSICLSVCPGLSGVFLGYLSLNLSQTLYTSLSSWGIVHL